MRLYVIKISVPKMFKNHSRKKNHPFWHKTKATSLSTQSEGWVLRLWLSDIGNSHNPSLPQVLIYESDIKISCFTCLIRYDNSDSSFLVFSNIRSSLLLRNLWANRPLLQEYFPRPFTGLVLPHYSGFSLNLSPLQMPPLAILPKIDLPLIVSMCFCSLHKS